MLGALNLYELLVIGLALVLVERRPRLRDGWVLLGLEALFLVDATFLGAEFFTISRSAGLLAAGASLGFAALKLHLVWRSLGVRLVTSPTALLTQLAAVLAVPGLLAELATLRWISPGLVYATWWGVALVVLLQPAAPRRKDVEGARLRLWWRAAPLLSLCVHLAAAGWVHGIAVEPAFLAPLVIAAAALGTRLDLARVSPRRRLALPAVAVALSLAPSQALLLQLGDVALSPLRVALLAAGLVYLYGWQQGGDRRFVHAAAVCLGAGWLGHSPAAIGAGLWGALAALVPRSALAWGVGAVGSAFALLGLGALVSFRSTRFSAEERVRR